MKKIISLLLVVMLLMSLAVGCSKKPAEEGPDKPVTEKPEDKPEDKPEEAEGKIVKFGLGKMVSIANSADGEGDKMAKSQADITVAAIGFDSDGKVQSVRIDVSQPKVEFDKDLKITSDIAEAVKSKHELKEDYGMKGTSEEIGIGKEWYEQMLEFENWMVGKTVEEIVGMKTKEANPDHPTVPDVEELTTTVSMDVGDYLAVVQDAWDNAVEVAGAEKVGLGFTTMLNNSKDMDGDKNALSQADATMTATAFDKDGKILKTVIDVVQVKVEYDKDGKLVTDKNAEMKSKHELKEEYDMKKASPIGKEWYEQMNAFQTWMEGKTVDEIVGMKTKALDEYHPTAPDVEELTSSVTMDVGDYLAVIKNASENAK